MANFKRAFVIRKLEGEDERIVFNYEEVENKNGKKVQQRTEKLICEARGWMVYLPTGASLHVRREDEMVRLGFMTPQTKRVVDGPLIDMETGETVQVDDGESIVRKAERISRKSRDHRLEDDILENVEA